MIAEFPLLQAADFYVSAFQDNPRFGISDWQQDTSDTAAEAVVSQGPESFPFFLYPLKSW